MNGLQEGQRQLAAMLIGRDFSFFGWIPAPSGAVADLRLRVFSIYGQ